MAQYSRYTIHLLANHKYLHAGALLTELEYHKCNCTFATLVNSVFSQIQKYQETAVLLDNQKIAQYLMQECEIKGLIFACSYGYVHYQLYISL